MAVTNFSPLLGLALPTTGDLSGTWGDTVNDAITSLLDSAVAGTTTLSTDANVTLSTTNGAANQARSAVLLCSGARTALRTITAPAQSKAYVVINATTGGFGVKVVGAGPTTGVTVTNGEKALIAWNGSDFVIVSSSVIDLTSEVTGTLPTGNGGTGLTTYTTGDTLYASASNTLSKLPIGTAGQVLTVVSGVPAWQSNGIPTQTGNANKLLTTDGTNTSWTNQIALTASSANPVVTITQTGAGHALLVEDSTSPDSTPFVIDASGNVGIGTTTPGGPLTVVSSGSSPVVVERNVDNNGGPNFQSYKSRGTYASPTIVQNADITGAFVTYGYDGAAYSLTTSVRGEVDGVPSAGSVPGRIIFLTSPGAGSSEAMRITSDQALLINQTAAYSFTNPYGTATTGRMQVTNTIAMVAAAANSQGGGVNFLKSRTSTPNSGTPLSSGDDLGYIGFYGDDGTNFLRGAQILAEADAAVTTGSMPTRLSFSTTASASSTPTERLRFSSDGAWGLAGANYGSSGQVLTSNGSAAAPTWQEVGTTGIANLAVTTAKIADAAVTTAKIADANVTSAKLADTAVTAGTYTAATITVNAKGQITAASTTTTAQQLRQQLFTASGSWVCPTGVTRVKAVVVGGGGGGGAGSNDGVINYSGGNGGLGGLSISYETVTPGTTYTITVGDGGNGSNTNATGGANGGTSSFGALCSATGGRGGAAATSSGNGANGNPGAGSGGNRANDSVSGSFADFAGGSLRGNGGSSTGNIVFSATNGLVPGSRGSGETSTTAGNASGGVNGVVLLEYVE